VEQAAQGAERQLERQPVPLARVQQQLDPAVDGVRPRHGPDLPQLLDRHPRVSGSDLPES